MVCKVDCFEDVFAKFLQGLVRYPSPFAEQHHCTNTFSSKASGNRQGYSFRVCIRTGPLRHTGQAPSTSGALSVKPAWRRGLIDHLWSMKLDSSATNTDQDLDVWAIAEVLEDSGVTKDSVILV